MKPLRPVRLRRQISEERAAGGALTWAEPNEETLLIFDTGVWPFQVGT